MDLVQFSLDHLLAVLHGFGQQSFAEIEGVNCYNTAIVWRRGVLEIRAVELEMGRIAFVIVDFPCTSDNNGFIVS